MMTFSCACDYYVQGKTWKRDQPALILIFVVVSSDKDSTAIVVGQAWWHGKGAYCL